MTNLFPLSKAGSLSVLSLLLSASLFGQLSISAEAICTSDGTMAVMPNTYYVAVETVTGGTGPYMVTVDGVTSAHDGSTTVYFGYFSHSGSGGSVQVVSAVADGSPDTGTMEVPEVLCEVRPDGGQASGAFCLPSLVHGAPYGAILAQSQYQVRSWREAQVVRYKNMYW
ncbi:MAG: hypothetical protein R2795_04805 [Saprospiraceae bacterium]